MAHIIFDTYDGKLNPIIGIPEKKIEELFNAINGINNVIFYYSLMFSVMDSFNELVHWKPIHNFARGNLIIRDLHSAERLTRSYLFEFRTVLDHMERSIKHDFGDNSQEWNIFKTNTSAAYDYIPEYAFSYHLRNCAQHCVNIVHGFNGTTGSCISCNKHQLMKDFSSWKPVDIKYMNSYYTDDIDLTSLFTKTNEALINALAPLIQHFIDEGDTLKLLWHVRYWGDYLQREFNKDVNCFHIFTPILANGSEASLEEWKTGKADSLDGIPIAWEEIYSLTNCLQPS